MSGSPVFTFEGELIGFLVGAKKEINLNIVLSINHPTFVIEYLSFPALELLELHEDYYLPLLKPFISKHFNLIESTVDVNFINQDQRDNLEKVKLIYQRMVNDSFYNLSEIKFLPPFEIGAYEEHLRLIEESCEPIAITYSELRLVLCYEKAKLFENSIKDELLNRCSKGYKKTVERMPLQTCEKVFDFYFQFYNENVAKKEKKY
ncbi:predicted protein [Naegleria gruberi]|uniref:Predicted protein n=1 Tax=Naegleria gruberi TaxID=5762 RepID=D2VEJ4_NAEGR|nr:uncharacterized protein NAEGRDRAFT_67299 [Naegleria gruberi]EFC44892.1 predicted protein [Naegleria gruberi]|eukprot:XP_002677636.1 predicted protein [Naegleria gruberi strain NEG-M]